MAAWDTLRKRNAWAQKKSARMNAAVVVVAAAHHRHHQKEAEDMLHRQRPEVEEDMHRPVVEAEDMRRPVVEEDTPRQKVEKDMVQQTRRTMVDMRRPSHRTTHTLDTAIDRTTVVAVAKEA
jgi:small-conductance mechanosensitive channel